MTTTSEIVVIGLGNPMRRDDSVGPYVVGRVQKDQSATCVHARSADPAILIDAWRDRKLAILLDASAIEDEPGRVQRFEINPLTDTLPVSELEQGAGSTHGFGLSHALHLGAALNMLPQRIVLYTVEGADFGHGEMLSPAVKRAALGLETAIRRDIKSARAIADSRGIAERKLVLASPDIEERN